MISLTKATKVGVLAGALIIIGIAVQPNIEKVQELRRITGQVIQTIQDQQTQSRKYTANNTPSERRITYQPKEGQIEDAEIFVYSDPTCFHCRDMHKEITKLNQQGVTVHVMLAPRAEPGNKDSMLAEKVWCSVNRHLAADAVMNGESLVDTPACDTEGLFKNSEDAELMGANGGRPFLVFKNGESLKGAITATEVVNLMQSMPQEKGSK